jgi:hypothetical protein
MNIVANIWDADRIVRLKDLKIHADDDKEPVYALYVFFSEKGIIRAGAIGVRRAFNTTLGDYSIHGNSISGRYIQYNKPGYGLVKRVPREKVLPWVARPFEYIWGATLTGGSEDRMPSVLLVAENIMHQRLQKSDMQYRGSSCHDCPDPARAIAVAQQSLEVFLRLAPEMFL